MNAFVYGVILQCRLDIRSKSLLITCYVVPLIFFFLMGSIFTSVMPEMKDTLIQTMIVLGVSMGTLLGLPPSLVETYASDIKKVYKANGIPLYFGLVTMLISAFIHLMIMSTIMLILAPIIFDATLPSNLLLFIASLAIYIAVSLSVGCILGLFVKNQAKLTMYSQLVFLPSMMLSGIMFPKEKLPDALCFVGKILPATWGYSLMLNNGFKIKNLLYLFIVFIISVSICALLLKKQKTE